MKVWHFAATILITCQGGEGCTNMFLWKLEFFLIYKVTLNTCNE